ncbi:MAG TPA: MASE1 domain-containing protein [Rhizomicrobium sp.]|nr:MASE1 domain-containing protein [Rhizomicrobium sp.]
MTISLDGAVSGAGLVRRLASGRFSPGRHNLRSWLIQTGIVFAAYYIAGRLGQASAARSVSVGPLWPAYGIALAALLRLGNRMIPAVAASAFLVSFHNPVPILVVAGQAFSTTFSAYCGSWLMRRFSFDCALPRLRDVLNLVLMGALISPMVSASLGTIVLYLAGIQPYAHVASAWLVYWMGDGTGVLLATPLALAAGNPKLHFKFQRAAEYVALNTLLLLSCLAIFADLGLPNVGQDCLTFSMLPFVMLIAIRFGLPGTTLSTILIATVATVATAQGAGPFARSATFTNAALLDVFYAVLSLTGITLCALIEARRRAELQRDELILRQAIVQVQDEANKKAALLQDQLAHLARVGMLNTLSGALAHEINQPLAAIRVNTEAAMYLLTKQTVPFEELRATLNDIREDGKRAGEVLNQARAMLKKETASREEVELNSAVGDVAKLMQPVTLKFGVQLDIQLESPSKPIWADRVQIQQVVMNLLMNACEAVQQKDRLHRQVRLTTSFSADMASVTVADNGPGISDADIKRLFEPFYTTKTSGMGLGLAICRSIVRAHYGGLTAVQNLDGGLTFAVELPLAVRTAQLEQPPENGENHAGA